MRVLITGFVCTCLLLLAGCGQQKITEAPVPKEPGATAIGFFCRMSLKEHEGPKGQIVLQDWTEPLWFSSVRDALTYVDEDIVSERQLAAFWVNDMEQGSWAQPAAGSWVEAKAAWYVNGSSKAAGMGGSEAVPFRRRGAAEAFIQQFGGRVADYGEARHAMTETAATGEMQETTYEH